MELLTLDELTEQDDPVQVWYGCYSESWQGLVSPAAFSHPAKFGRGLVRRMYDYALERGWVKPGDTVLDPFGGVGLGALDAMANGLNWVGCELENRFALIGNGCDCVGVSPARFQFPADTPAPTDIYRCPDCLTELARLVKDGLPPAGQMSLFDRAEDSRLPPGWRLDENGTPYSLPHHYTGNLELFSRYAQPGAWSVLLQGDSRYLSQRLAEAGMIASSPPYVNVDPAKNSKGIDIRKQWETYRASGGGMSFDGFSQLQAKHSQGYGSTPGNLGNLPAGNLDGILSSPPYAGSRIVQEGGDDTKNIRRQTDKGRYGRTDGQLGGLPVGDLDGILSSPPYANGTVNDRNGIDPTKFNRAYGRNSQALTMSGYGDSDGQLNNLPTGDLDALISSSPFAGNTGGRGEASRNGIDAALFDRHSGGMKRGTGDDPANLDHLPMKDFDLAVGSPPFERGSEGVMRSGKFKDPAAFAREQMKKGHGCSFEAKMRAMEADNNRAHYGQHPDQLGNTQGQTFWAAARQILTECYLVLKPGAYCFWVTKAFCRDGAIVDFPGQWRQLCEAVGFEFVEEIRAMQVSREAHQGTLAGEVEKQQKATKSFFRRLYEKKNPHLSIDWETVVVMRKPL